MLNSRLVTEVATIARSPLKRSILGMWFMSAFLGIAMWRIKLDVRNASIQWWQM